MNDMKSIKIYLATAFLILCTACTDILDTRYEGAIIPEDQKNAAGEANPALFDADVNAMYALMIQNQVGTSWTTSTYHNDYGMPALALMMESNGQDLTCPNIGYNWFNNFLAFTDRDYEGAYSRMFWTIFYKQIRAANAILAAIPADSENEQLLYYRGQALAFRAFNYWNLAQLYQFTYKGNEDKSCVPIITEEIVSNDNPRKTVKEVYDFILSDLDGEKGAVELLGGYARPSKVYIDQAVAYGIRARVNLVMQNWTEAANDAARALEVSGATPYTFSEVSKPTFNTAGAKGVIWANLVTPDNDVVQTGIINWPSHLCSFSGNGYVSVGGVRSIAQPLYDQIPSTDVRKGWWLNENSASPLVANSAYDGWRDAMSAYIAPLLNVKFGAYNDEPMNTVNAQDWILMRAEEMILIQAEATAMGGNPAGGKQILENFVKTYRNASYTCPASDAQGIQEAVWIQRRIELWGEGFAFFDIMRLHKPIIRVGSTFDLIFTFDIPVDDPILLRLIPRTEIESNGAISHPGDNNPVAPVPQPMG
jgi:hypothetical protein